MSSIDSDAQSALGVAFRVAAVLVYPLPARSAGIMEENIAADNRAGAGAVIRVEIPLAQDQKL